MKKKPINIDFGTLNAKTGQKMAYGQLLFLALKSSAPYEAVQNEITFHGTLVST